MVQWPTTALQKNKIRSLAEAQGHAGDLEGVQALTNPQSQAAAA
jgi:hypothetical protein